MVLTCARWLCRCGSLSAGSADTSTDRDRVTLRASFANFDSPAPSDTVLHPHNNTIIPFNTLTLLLLTRVIATICLPPLSYLSLVPLHYIYVPSYLVLIDLFKYCNETSSSLYTRLLFKSTQIKLIFIRNILCSDVIKNKNCVAESVSEFTRYILIQQ